MGVTREISKWKQKKRTISGEDVMLEESAGTSNARGETVQKMDKRY